METKYLTLFLISKRNFKRPGTLFFINLAVCDMLKATFNLPLTVASSYAQRWLFGQIGKLFLNLVLKISLYKLLRRVLSKI